MGLRNIILLAIIVGISLAKAEHLNLKPKVNQETAHKKNDKTTEVEVKETAEKNTFTGSKGQTVSEDVNIKDTTIKTRETNVKMISVASILFWTPKQLRYTLGNYTGVISLKSIVNEYAKSKPALFNLLKADFFKFNELFTTADSTDFDFSYDWLNMRQDDVELFLPVMIKNTIYNKSIGLLETPKLTDVAIVRTIRHIKNCKRGFVLKRFRGKDINKIYQTSNGVTTTKKAFFMVIASCRDPNNIEVFSFAAKKDFSFKSPYQVNANTKAFSIRFMVRWLSNNWKLIFGDATCQTGTIKESFSTRFNYTAGTEFKLMTQQEYES